MGHGMTFRVDAVNLLAPGTCAVAGMMAGQLKGAGGGRGSGDSGRASLAAKFFLEHGYRAWRGRGGVKRACV